MLNKNDKLEVALLLLEAGDMKVHLDARQPGVVVPPHCKQDPHLILQIGRDMPIPIKDLKVTKRGIRGTLSFNRRPFRCVLPWRSIYMLVGVGERGNIWEEHVPPELTVSQSGSVLTLNKTLLN